MKILFFDQQLAKKDKKIKNIWMIKFIFSNLNTPSKNSDL